ncbi:MAG: hypothetical protein JWP27_2752 [Flaviaesturariibacter sp.]|nr:hypothetical protein [Flaviaesturariibacter sp.]
MRLPIHDNLTIADLQERFATAFPRLRIEFYSKAHGDKKGSGKEDLLDKQKRIGEVRTRGDEGVQEIFSTMTVRDVEKIFHDRYGLNVQVFRREAGCIVQTTSTDHYTLAQQSALVADVEKTVFAVDKAQQDEYDDL